MSLFIGIDIGTSACRACAIDSRAKPVAEARNPLPPPETSTAGAQQDPQIWWQVLGATLDQLFARIDPARVRRILIDGTSSTLLLSDPAGQPLTSALMYNDARATQAARQIRQRAPENSAAQGAGSSLAKLLYLRNQVHTATCLALHQADWLTGKLCGRFGTSDENNALKLGYDLENHRWPTWIGELGVDADSLPRVQRPGTVVGTLEASLAQRWQCPADVEIAAGTTDSTAGFIAAGAARPATAVTALGSTLVLKILSPRPVYSAAQGVYSHRLGDRWLVGGASNAGGTLLRELFTACDIKRYTRLMKPRQPTGLDYYPLSRSGERFPVNDPALQPVLTPRPASDAVFFQAILEGLAKIELRGYRLLETLGAPYPERVITVGGGAVNRHWQTIRADLLGIPVERAAHQEAAFGAALLALRGEAVFADV